jgi:membrane protease YdiL (CAAX protease family)
MVINAGFVAPFNEEIVFRKTLHDIVGKYKWIFIGLSFLLFGGAHVISSATTILDYLYIIPYGALGAAFAFAYSKTNTIYTSMTIHMIHNTVLILLSIMI